MGKPRLDELAADWCKAKTVGARSASGNSDRARRSDLARWGRTIRTVRGQDVDESVQLELSVELRGFYASDLSVDTLLSAAEALKMTYKPATLQRLISHMRGFTRWLVSTGHLVENPMDSDLLRIRSTSEMVVRAFTANDVQAMIATAESPAANTRTAWGARDGAIVDLLASTGVRSNECVSLQIGDIGGADRPILLVRRGTKSGTRREIPLPRHVTSRLDIYMAERVDRGLARGPRQPLFVKADGKALTNANLHYLVKRISRAAGATLPDDALVHGLRHHFGLQLALRSLPPATLQQLMGHKDPRTTAMYTKHASFDLVNALDDAGWL